MGILPKGDKEASTLRLMTRNRGNLEKRDKKLNNSNNIRKGPRSRLGAVRWDNNYISSSKSR